MTSKRNLVVILAGGLRGDAFGHIGAWPVRTPQLDQIAATGVALSAITASPASGPSHISLFTGLAPRQHGVLDDPSPPIWRGGGWPRQFFEAGYHLAGVGRVGLIADDLHEAAVVADLATEKPEDCAYLSFARHRGLLNWVLEQRRQRLRCGPLEVSTSLAVNPSDDVDGFITQQASLMIERLPADRSWVLIIALSGPGNDLPAPAPFANQIKADDLLAGFSPPDFRNADRYAEPQFPRAVLQQATPFDIVELRRHYLARVAMLDHTVGAIRSALDRAGHARFTWISLCSDHGKLLGERGLIGHRALLGPALYVPLWILPPAGLPRKTWIDESPSQRLLSTADFVATLCAIGGVDPPRGCVGQSVLPAMHGRQVGGDAVVSEFGTRLMLETLQHRAAFDTETLEPRFLFDLIRDQREIDDLLGTPHGLNLIDMLRWQLANCLMPLRPVRAA